MPADSRLELAEAAVDYFDCSIMTLLTEIERYGRTNRIGTSDDFARRLIALREAHSHARSILSIEQETTEGRAIRARRNADSRKPEELSDEELREIVRNASVLSV